MKLLILLTFILTSCFTEQRAIRDITASNNSTNATQEEELDDKITEFSEPEILIETSWFNQGNSSNTIDLDLDTKRNVYIYGTKTISMIERNLAQSNVQPIYCVIIDFVQTTQNSPKPLAVRANAVSSSQTIPPTQSSSGELFYYDKSLLVSTGNNFGNSVCNKKIRAIVDGVSKDIAVDPNLVNDLEDVCVGCQGLITAASVKLYIFDESIGSLVQQDELITNSLNIRFDPNNNSDNAINNCSNSECIAQGFDCCQEGQCITEKAVKVAGVSADPSGFAVAEALKASNPNWYKDYPQFYYACLEVPPEDEQPPSDPADPTDPIGDSQTRLNELIADYNCVEELKTNSLTDPFHNNPINGSATYNACNVLDPTNTMYYQEVMKRLYLNCGCSEKTDLNTMISNCPAYTYSPTYARDNLGNITSTIENIICVSPDAVQTPLPFQDLEILLNSRSAPHRFFDTKNIEIYSNEAIPSNTSGVQEGQEFSYLDNGYIFPNNGSFNMNSIIGQMTVQLDQALPAYKITVDFDKRYLISAKSGFFQNCPDCAKDSWFDNFSSNPFANYGVGIQPVYFTTRRDTYNSNTTLGNYEDTIFSRACYVPPTMLPYSHYPDSDVQIQRLNRLKTQAALFVNGYQRDWYGFNKGALIGSFDGVTWFAIGKGRVVQSTTNTLYLAINAPFADLTSPTNHLVAIQEYQNQATAAAYDFDPALEINDSSQNEAGSCQEWHTCETDSHCITKLGWEYACADVTYTRSNWPRFEVDKAQEISNVTKNASIVEFLQQGILPPGSSSKRCVYRGAGSVCRTDYDNITDETLRKNLTCAPNFYCAPLTSSKAFNSEVARYGRPLDELIGAKNHRYGQDADILGRPKHYLDTGNLGALPSEAITALNENLSTMDPSGSGRFGVCRPGKLLPSYNSLIDTRDWSPTEQHKKPDPSYRTDYTSQIGACNATLYTDLRYSSCPILDEEGNYVHTKEDYLNDNYLIPGQTIPQAKKAITAYYSMAQNSCGLESLDAGAVITQNTTGAELKQFSAFKTIEGEPLSSSATIIDQTIARNSCLRKAGAVCHTDLDCSPNRLQASVIDLVPASFFGNTAEKKYYEEFLVCGQAEDEPTSTSDSNFNTYSMHNNRCCRPVGQDLTMYTEDSPNAIESQGLDTSVFGALNPQAPNRYSRYSVVEGTINSFTKKSNIIRPSANTTDADGNKSIDSSVNITNVNQWRTINSAASRTCCGGSWIRKFEDGSNNWGVNRLNINPANFKCLNYRSALALTENTDAYDPAFGTPDQAQSTFRAQLEKDRVDFCFDPSQTSSGCIQRSIAGIENLSSIKKPVLNGDTGTGYLSSGLVNMEDEWKANPFVYGFLVPYSGFSISDEDFRARGYVLPWSDDDDPANITRKNFITRIPTFVDVPEPVVVVPFAPAIPTLNIRLTDPQPGTTTPEITCAPARILSRVDGGIDSEEAEWEEALPFYACPDTGPADRNCCYVYDPLTRLLRVGFSNADKLDATNYDNIDVELRMDIPPAVGSLGYEQIKTISAVSVEDENFLDYRRSSTPGNALYYLKKLARLEYNGIPQMVYEPLYCNDIYQKMVPGIFKEEAFGQALKTVSDFINHDRTFLDPNIDTPWGPDPAPAGPNNADALNQNLVGTQELLETEQIFSDNQFKCCLELGSTIDATDDPSMCCSGVATSDPEDDTKKICKLPVGTNLTVYFNKFVSGEGLSSKLTTPLELDDFDPKTGEPKLNETVITKLQALGEEFCETGQTRRGSAFGDYRGQPVGPQGSIEAALFSIVDDPADFEAESSPPKDYNTFLDGYRWNHHIYCGNVE